MSRGQYSLHPLRYSPENDFLVMITFSFLGASSDPEPQRGLLCRFSALCAAAPGGATHSRAAQGASLRAQEQGTAHSDSLAALPAGLIQLAGQGQRAHEGAASRGQGVYRLKSTVLR